MDNDRHGIRASGEYVTYDGREYFAHSLGGGRVRLLSDDDPLHPTFHLSTMDWVRGEAIVPMADVERIYRVRTVGRWYGYRFEVGVIVGDRAAVTYLGGRFDEVSGLPGLHRPDKYEVMGEVPVSELTGVEEHLALRNSESDIADALRSTMRKGDGLSVPYAREWQIGGCEPEHSLRTFPYDGVQILAAGLAGLDRSVYAAPDRVIVESWARSCWVAANRSSRGEGAPDAYLVGVEADGTGRYVGNAPEVVVELVREALGSGARTATRNDVVQVGFPGRQDSATTYVGSWQWDVHGEVSDQGLIRRAAGATLRAIDARRQHDASPPPG
jgi:hypothetical protein